MGTPLPPNEPGIACPLCFGAGGPLGPVPPKFVWLNFRDVKPGPDPLGVRQGIIPSGSWYLKCTDSCLYELNLPLWHITLLWGASSTLVRWRDASNALLFNTIFPSATCARFVYSAVQYSPTVVAYGGSCQITWSKEGLS